MMRIVVVVVVVASAARVERARVDDRGRVERRQNGRFRGGARSGASRDERRGGVSSARVGDGRGRAGRRVDGGGDVCGDQCDVGDAMRGGDGVVEVSARAGWRARPRRGV